MTVDSLPISRRGQRGAGFMAAHGAFNVYAYAAIASSAKFSSFAFMFIESDFREVSFSACTSSFATHVEARSPPMIVLINYNITVCYMHFFIAFSIVLNDVNGKN